MTSIPLPDIVPHMNSTPVTSHAKSENVQKSIDSQLNTEEQLATVEHRSNPPNVELSNEETVEMTSMPSVITVPMIDERTLP